MHRQILLILTMFLVALCVCVVSFAVSGVMSETDHTHNYVLKNETATCTEEGVRYYECSCGDSYSETVAALGHALQLTTEEGSGRHWQQCTRCGITMLPQDHNFADVPGEGRPSTCTEAGFTLQRCVCGATQKQSLPLAEHDYTLRYDETRHWQACTVCGTRDESSLQAHSFDIVLNNVHSTCVEQGSLTKQCSCGATETQQLPLADHSYTKYAISYDEHWLVCAVCSEEKSGSREPHDKRTAVVPPTCTEDGSTTSKCDCGWTMVSTQSAPGHDFDRNVPIQRDDNNHAYKCKRCEASELEKHSFGQCTDPDKQDVEPTCGNEGHHYEQCTVCNYVLDNVISATGNHVWSETFDSNADEHWRSCEECGHKDAKEAHSWKEIENEKSTCTERGKLTEQCSVCSKTRQTDLDTIPHDYKEVPNTRQEPTCTQEGRVDEQCSMCGEQKTEAIPKLGHDWQVVEEGRVAPTCVAAGRHTEKCNNCQETRNVTDSNEGIAHETQEVAAKTPTETSQGWIRHWKCTVCGKYFKTKEANEDDELKENDVFIPATGAQMVGSIEELIKLAQDEYLHAQSQTKYMISAKVAEKNDSELTLGDSPSIKLSFADTIYDVKTISKGNTVTVRGYIRAVGDSVEFLDKEIVSVDDGDPDTFTLDIRIKGTMNSMLLAYDLSDTVITGPTVKFNVLSKGQKISFTYFGGDVRVTVNGNACDVKGGSCEVTIAGDTVIEFDFTDEAESALSAANLSNWKQLQNIAFVGDFCTPYGVFKQQAAYSR